MPDIEVAKLANAKTYFLFIIFHICPLILIRKIRFIKSYKVYNR